MGDGSITNEWFPVAIEAEVLPGSWHPFELLDDRYVLVRTSMGEVMVVRDTCPHRGAQLTLGRFDGDVLTCAYHGWRFNGAGGRCLLRPAHPHQVAPDYAALSPLSVQAAYGLWWVCVGEQPRNLPGYDAFDRYPGQSVILGPKLVQSSGPRIVENFLDMAHFPFVHPGYLGQEPQTEVTECDVAVVDGELRMTNCRFWQPVPGPASSVGGVVEYEYGVSHPYAARLTKVPSAADGGELAAFSILIVAAPMSEIECRVFNVSTMFDPDVDLAAANEFQAVILEQDVPTVESQRPTRLPLDGRAEVHQRADKASLAYRKWLKARRVTYGVC
jgi:phenylpropionate dioxygenase-like ring-hydroxylating dioxygenase large terminal subunit